MAELAGALRALAATRRSGGDGDDASRAPKTLSEAYKETYSTLLRFGNVAAGPGWQTVARGSNMWSSRKSSTRYAWPEGCRRRSMSRS